MKTCPKCHMRLEANFECPACGQNITDEPVTDEENEKYVFNKYLLLYLLKHAKFLALCIILCIVGINLRLPDISIWYLLLALLCLIFCFCENFCPNKLHSLWRYKYTEEYIEATAKLTKYLSGALAVLVVFVF